MFCDINARLFDQKIYLSFYEYFEHCNEIINKSLTFSINKSIIESYKNYNEFHINMTKIIHNYKINYSNCEELINDLQLEENVDYKYFDNRHMITGKCFKKIILLSTKINFNIKKMILNHFLFLDDCIMEYSNYINLHNSADFFLLQNRIKEINERFSSRINVFNNQVDNKLKKIEKIVDIVNNPNSTFIKYISDVMDFNKDYMKKNNKELSNNIYKMINKMDSNYERYNNLIEKIPNNHIILESTFESKFADQLENFNQQIEKKMDEKITELKDKFNDIALERFNDIFL